MLLNTSRKAKPVETRQSIVAALEKVDREYLRSTVAELAIPRHYVKEADNNRLIRDWLLREFTALGYHAQTQGQYDNVVASAFNSNINLPAFLLVGAHYDSVPGTPGADDNASAVAAMLGVARALKHAGVEQPAVLFVAFNREEDDLLGSKGFVQYYLDEQPYEIREAHVLEMVGFARHEPGSQRLPKGLPIRLPERADFLGVIGKRKSNKSVKKILQVGKAYLPEFEILGLRVFMGLDKKVRDVRRSDHAPFWDKKIPALMWTDTSEFRNPHYHLPSDTPDTLDYEFLANVTRALLAYVLTQI